MEYTADDLTKACVKLGEISSMAGMATEEAERFCEIMSDVIKKLPPLDASLLDLNPNLSWWQRRQLKKQFAKINAQLEAQT